MVAHAGHWLVEVAYLAPLAALVVILIVGRLRERRERRGSAADTREAGEPPASRPPRAD